MKASILLTLAVGLTLTACDSDGNPESDAPVEDTAEPERTGGPTTTIADEPATVDPDAIPEGGWAVGQFVCEPPPDDADEFDFVGEYVSPVGVAPGGTITVSLDEATVAAALDRDPATTEVVSYGGDHVVLACWADDGWVPVWLVRLPGFVTIEGDDEDGELVDGIDERPGSYQLGPQVAITGIDLLDPFTVDAEVPAEIPAGQYRWIKTVALGEDERFVIVQPVEIIDG